jgi:predicted metal-dependent hydrolase
MTREAGDPGAEGQVTAALSEWSRLFQEGRYFEAHEALEACRLAAAEPEKGWLKGLIHAAVALHHHQRGNAHGARVKSASGLRYLAGAPDDWKGVEIPAVRARIGTLVDTVSG